MTEKQKKILRLGMALRKNREDETSKGFVEILEESLSTESKTNLFNNLKAEIIIRGDNKKAQIDAEKEDIS
jgi:hypothetical protein